MHSNYTPIFLSLLKDAVVTLDLKKGSILTNKIDYIEIIIRPGRLKVANHIYDAVRNVMIPTRKPELSSFTGFVTTSTSLFRVLPASGHC